MEGKKIYGAIIGVMKDVGAVGKSKRNAQQGFTYRGIDDVMNALQPAMIKNGVFCSTGGIGRTPGGKDNKKWKRDVFCKAYGSVPVLCRGRELH